MEKTLSVSSARQNLMKLTKEISDRMDRVVLTNKGRAETVLLSVAEYQSLKAAAQLLTHPQAFTEMNRGFQEIAEGQGLTLQQSFEKPIVEASVVRSK